MQGTMEYHDSEDIEAKVARCRTGILRDLCPSNRKRSDQLQVNQRDMFLMPLIYNYVYEEFG